LKHLWKGFVEPVKGVLGR